MHAAVEDSLFSSKSMILPRQSEGIVSLRVWFLVAAVGAVAVSVLLGLQYMHSSDVHEADVSSTVVGKPTAGRDPFRLHVDSPRDTAKTHESQITAGSICFQDVSEESGVTFKHRDGSSGRHFTPETMSTGIATFDFDGDGLIDIYFPNGAALPGVTYDPPPRHALYRNLGNGKFQDVSHSAGIDCTAFGLGVTVGDVDNDGFPDVYLNNFGPNILYCNNGDGTFTEMTDRAGVQGTTVSGDLSKKVGAGACFLDLTGNGCLDLFSGNYIEIDLETYITPMKGDLPFYPSPMAYDPVPNTLYENMGDGAFKDISVASGIADYPGRCMGTTACDFNRDGHTDIFVCNDVFANFLLQNDGQGRFTEVGLVAGVAMNPSAEMVANMAVDAGDYDNDGWPDFFTTNYEQQNPLLLHNLGDGNFVNETFSARVGESVFGLVNVMPKSCPHSPTWVHLGGVASRYCHHRHSGSIAVTGGSSRARGCSANPVHQQPETVGPCFAQLSRCAQTILVEL